MKNPHITLDESVPGYKLTRNQKLKRKLLNLISPHRWKLRRKIASLTFTDKELEYYIQEFSK